MHCPRDHVFKSTYWVISFFTEAWVPSIFIFIFEARIWINTKEMDSREGDAKQRSK
jgi:hypothetical protein